MLAGEHSEGELASLVVSLAYFLPGFIRLSGIDHPIVPCRAHATRVW